MVDPGYFILFVKGLLSILPIPFCFAVMSVARPIDASNAVGLLMLLLFTHGVRWLHYHAGQKIIVSIALSAG